MTPLPKQHGEDGNSAKDRLQNESLNDAESSNQQVWLRDIKLSTAQHFGLTIADLEGASRTRTVALARGIAMYIAKKMTDMSYPQIGRFMGNRTHTAVAAAVARIRQLVKQNKVIRWTTEVESCEESAPQLLMHLEETVRLQAQTPVALEVNESEGDSGGQHTSRIPRAQELTCLPPDELSGRSVYTSPTRGQKGSLRLAVIGCGYWGPNLVRNFMSLRDCQVAAVADINEERLEYVGRLWPGVRTTADYKEVVDDAEIDAVVIATPVRLHYPMACRSLSAGKHTFVERPMAHSLAAAVRLVELAERNHLTLMVGHTFVYSAPVRWIARMVDKGVLGEIQYISARRLSLGLFQKDINVAWDLAPHDLSIILYVMKHTLPVSVCCSGKAHLTEGIEDVTSMSLHFSNGAFATIQSSWLDPNKTREMTFVGSRRMLVYNDIANNEKIKIYDKHVEVPRHYDTFGEFHYSYHYGDMRSPYLKQTEPLKVECEHFLDCVRTGATSESSGRDGLMVVRILEAASESLRTGGRQIPLNLAQTPTSQRSINPPNYDQTVQAGESRLRSLSPTQDMSARNVISRSRAPVLPVNRMRDSE